MFALVVIGMCTLFWILAGWYALIVRTDFFDGLDEAVVEQTPFQHLQTFMSILRATILWPTLMPGPNDYDDDENDDDASHA